MTGMMSALRKQGSERFSLPLPAPALPHLPRMASVSVMLALTRARRGESTPLLPPAPPLPLWREPSSTRIKAGVDIKPKGSRTSHVGSLPGPWWPASGRVVA